MNLPIRIVFKIEYLRHRVPESIPGRNQEYVLKFLSKSWFTVCQYLDIQFQLKESLILVTVLQIEFLLAKRVELVIEIGKNGLTSIQSHTDLVRDELVSKLVHELRFTSPFFQIHL